MDVKTKRLISQYKPVLEHPVNNNNDIFSIFYYLLFYFFDIVFGGSDGNVANATKTTMQLLFINCFNYIIYIFNFIYLYTYIYIYLLDLYIL